MKTLGIEQATLDSCVREAQGDRVLLTRDGRPVAVVVGLAGLDDEQIAIGMSEDFWRLITARRQEPSITRSELEHRLSEADKRR
ncbi:MAG: hypothetical protein NTW36_01935 [Planctomycetia bacterium]|nr:hypothetical protein [Planctomycetia bacterium]